MGKRESKYLISLEVFHKEVSSNYVLSNIDLRLKRYSKCVKAMILRGELEGLLNNIKNNIPDMEECGIDYMEWSSANKWKDANAKDVTPNRNVKESEFVGELSKCVDNYGKANKKEYKENGYYGFNTGFKEDQILTGFKYLMSNENASDYMLDIVFSQQILNIRNALFNIYLSKQAQDEDKISDDVFLELYQRYEKQYHNICTKGKLESQYKDFKKTYLKETDLAHFKMMRGDIITSIIESDFIQHDVQQEVVNEDAIEQYKQELYISSSKNLFDLSDDSIAKSYHKFRRFFSYQCNKYIPDYAKIGRELYDMRDEITDNEISVLIWLILLIGKIQEKMVEKGVIEDNPWVKELKTYVIPLKDHYNGKDFDGLWNELIAEDSNLIKTNGKKPLTCFEPRNSTRGGFDKVMAQTITGRMYSKGMFGEMEYNDVAKQLEKKPRACAQQISNGAKDYKDSTLTDDSKKKIDKIIDKYC